MLARAGMDDGRPGNDEDFAGLAPYALDFAGQVVNERVFRPLGRKTSVKELENVRSRCRALKRRNADSVMPGDDRVALAHIVETNCACAAALPIDADGAVHHRSLHFDLFAVEPDEGVLVGCDVKVVWEDSVARRLRELRILRSEGRRV